MNTRQSIGFVAGGWVEGWQEAIDGAGGRVALGVALRTTGSVRWSLQGRVGVTDAAEDVSIAAAVSFGRRGPTSGPPGVWQ